ARLDGLRGDTEDPCTPGRDPGRIRAVPHPDQPGPLDALPVHAGGVVQCPECGSSALGARVRIGCGQTTDSPCHLWRHPWRRVVVPVRKGTATSVEAPLHRVAVLLVPWDGSVEHLERKKPDTVDVGANGHVAG